MASGLYHRYVPPKPVATSQVEEKSVTQVTETLKDGAFSRRKSDDKKQAPKKEKSKKRKALELADGQNDGNDEEPSKKHKAVFGKFERSSKIADNLRRKKSARDTKIIATEKPEENSKLHGMYA